MALAAQGFADRAPTGAVDRRHLRRVMGRVGLLQLDSVSAVARTQYLIPFSRLGPYEPTLLDRVAYRDGEWFEAWAHEASLLPVATEPLLRWHKARCRAGETWAGLVRLAEEEAPYVGEVLAQVRERGPIAARELDDPRRQEGAWWAGRSLGAQALEWLFRIGEVGIRRTASFVKRYDVLERIVPADVLSGPTPSEERAHRELLLRSAASLGVATAADLVDYYRLPRRPARSRLAELVEDGRLREVRVEGWPKPGYLHPDARLPRRIAGAALLSPFDPVVWHRPRATALFDFRYRIEIYTPKERRRFGYYVLPFLLGDRLVGRMDVKADRAEGVLRVDGAWIEDHADSADVVEPLREQLGRLAAFVGVDHVAIGRRGNLSAALR